MLNEIECIKAYMQGDELAFEELYNQYFPKIYNFIYYKVQNKEQTEDLVSETFHKLIKNLQQFDNSRGKFSTWIYQIARNTVIDFFRNHHQTSDIEDAFDIASTEDIERQTDASLKLEKVEKYLKTLKAEQREIIVLRVWEDLSYKEIADIIGKKESAVKMQFIRSIKKVKQEHFLLYLIMLTI